MKPTFTTKTELAQAYFPHLEMRSARHKLMQVINSDSHLIQLLTEQGYEPNHHHFTPAQVTTIINRLGSPF